MRIQRIPEKVYNQQLKPAIKKNQKPNFVFLGVLYDAERLYLFQKRKTEMSFALMSLITKKVIKAQQKIYQFT